MKNNEFNEYKITKMKYRICYIGDPILRKQAEHINRFDEELQHTVKEMTSIMYKEDGIGLAAPQIGLSIQLIIIDASPVDKEEFLRIFINPQILESSGESTIEEGCLSIPGVREDVIRPEHIKLNYFDEYGKEYTEYFDDWPARIIQHEVDHLYGVLFVDHISPVKRDMLINQEVIPALY